MDELMGRLAEVTDLGRTAMLLAWDQEVCMPRGAAAEHGELRATIGRLARERFVDDRVGELLEAGDPRDDVEADAVKVTRRDWSGPAAGAGHAAQPPATRQATDRPRLPDQRGR
jgi:carboxypeptidase Taq